MTAPAGRRGRRSAARLAAVQALYQLDVGGGEIAGVVGEFLEHRLGAGDDALDADPELFATLARGAIERRDELDGLIGEALAPDWTLDRLEILLRAVLRVGAYEMLACPDSPAKVVIDEYIDVAHEFFGQGPPGLVNGVLDRLAHTLRAAEMAPQSG